MSFPRGQTPRVGDHPGWGSGTATLVPPEQTHCSKAKPDPGKHPQAQQRESEGNVPPRASWLHTPDMRHPKLDRGAVGMVKNTPRPSHPSPASIPPIFFQEVGIGAEKRPVNVTRGQWSVSRGQPAPTENPTTTTPNPSARAEPPPAEHTCLGLQT